MYLTVTNFDADNSGFIDKREVFVALKGQEMQHQRERQIAQLKGDGELVEDKDMDIDRVESILAMGDMDGNQFLDFKEFVMLFKDAVGLTYK